LSEKACCVTLTLPTMPRRLLLAFLLALAVPASASAGLATLQVRELPLHGERSLSAVTPASPFQLVGIHWQGSGRLELRIRTARGWSAWRAVRADGEDTPDATSREARAMHGWRLGAPVWVGRGEELEVRAIGHVARARALTVRSPVSKVPLRTVAAAGLPRIVPRSGWQADESIVRAKPQYADALRMAYVHHTAGTNGYTRLQAPAIVRAIELYHVKGNGWNDIGYNALVDRFGTVYEGRAGGVDRNVVGAHAKGFNTGSFGIAVMGDFRTADPPAAAVDALVKTLAWRLDLGHVDPLGTFNGISSGNERFGPGIPVFLRAVSGHRDTGLTTCPGQKLYDLIPGIAKRVAALGLPKLYAPAVAADESGGTRFTARLSSALPWTVRITDPAGTELGRGEGTGTTVDWTWLSDGPVAAGTRWEISSPGAIAATGALSETAAAALALTGARADPATVTPNGDGQADTTTISYTLNANANVAVSVIDVGGATVAQLEPKQWRRAGARSVVLDGKDLADGAYVVHVTANATGGRSATVDVPVTVTRTLGRITLAADAVTPNGDGRNDTLSLAVPLGAPATLTVRILRGGKWVATPFAAAVDAGTQNVTWDGSKRVGKALDGPYVASVEVVDAVGTATVELPFAVDATAPVVRVVSAVPPRIWVSEAATLEVRVNGARRVMRTTGPGAVRIPRIERLRTLVVVARDAAGNASTLRR
jgi:N-acetylmuramoyl-L-alanine amidase-like protein